MAIKRTNEGETPEARPMIGVKELVERHKLSTSVDKPVNKPKKPVKKSIPYNIPKLKEGRPTTYTQELADHICAELATGRSLRSVCLPDDMPEIRSIYNWFRTYPQFLQQYEVAKQESADAMAEEVLAIADDATNDFMEDEYNKGRTPGYQLNGENIQRSRLRVDTRKWLMAKMKPKKYGEKVDITSDGKALPTPILGGISLVKEDETDDVSSL